MKTGTKTTFNRSPLLLAILLYVCNLSANIIINPGFEQPDFSGATKWSYLHNATPNTDGVPGGWRFINSGGGIAYNNTPWVKISPEGVQSAFLQGSGNMEQDVILTVNGYYSLSFQAANRPNYPSSHLKVLLGGNEIGYWTSAELGSAANPTFRQFTIDLGLLESGTYTLTFDAINPGVASAVSIDDVQFTLDATAQYWNPDPLSSNWNHAAWAANSGWEGTNAWQDGNIAYFDQNSSYTVSVDSATSAKWIVIDDGTVHLTGTETVSSEFIDIAAGATLSGAGARYLKSGATDFELDGTLAMDTLDDTNRVANLNSGSGLVVLNSDATLAVNGTGAFAGSVSGAGNLIKVGSNRLYLNNSFTGTLEVREGYLGLLNAAAGDVNVSSAEAGLAYAQPTELIAALNDAGSVFAEGAMVGLNVTSDITDPALGGVNFGDTRFLKLGSAVLNLTSSAPLAGAVNGAVVAEGDLFYKASGAVPIGKTIEVLDGGCLKINYAPVMNFDHPLILSGNYDEFDSQGALYLTKNSATINLLDTITLEDDTKIKAFSTTMTVNFDAPITGTGNLVISGGGAATDHWKVFNFNAPCEFSGDVTLKNDGGSQAYFNWNVDNALPTNSLLKVGGTGSQSAYTTALDLKGYAQQSAGLADAVVATANRYITNSAATAATLALKVDGGLLEYTGALAGDFEIIKRGDGMQRLLSDGSTFTGTLNVEGGALWIDANTAQNALINVVNGGQIIPYANIVNVGHTTLSGIGYGDNKGALLFENDKNDTWNGNITINGYTRIGAYTGGIMNKIINGVIDGAGTLNIWAGGAGLTHENVFILTGANSFEGPLQMDATHGAALTVKLRGADNRLPDATPVLFNPTWREVFCRLDLEGTAAQRVGGLISAGNTNQCHAVINSTAATTSTLTINTIGGTAHFEGVIGASGPCVSPGAINLIKEGHGAQIFDRGSEFTWIDGTIGTNIVNADITVNNGAIGLSGTNMLGSLHTVTCNADGALLAPNKATLEALRADGRVTLDITSPVGLYDTWDISAVDPERRFYYSGNALINSDNTGILTNGLILAGGLIRVGLDGAAGDTVFGPTNTPLILNGTSIKNSDNTPILSSDRTITVNDGGVAFTAGWYKNFEIHSILSGSGAVNVNCDYGNIILSNTANDYSGGTTIGVQWSGYAGTVATLKLGASEVIPHGSGKGDLAFENNGTLDLNGFNETVNGLNSASDDALITNSTPNVALLTVGADDADGSYNGAVGGFVELVKTGNGTQILDSGCVIDTQAQVTIQGGTLILEDGCSVSSQTVVVHRDGTLVLNGDNIFSGSASATRLFAGINKSTQGEQAKIEIPDGVNVTLLHFAIDGVFKTAGTWGASGSGADNIDDTIFIGSGTLTVLETGPASGTLMILM